MTATSTNSNPGVSRSNPLIRILPFIILAAGAIVLALKWDSIPDRWAVHWGIDGRPDRWAHKSISEAFLPIGAGVLLCLFFEAIAWFVTFVARRRADDRLTPETAMAVASLTADLLRFLEIAMSIVFLFMALWLPLARLATPGGFVVVVLAVIGGAVALGILRLSRGIRELKRAGHKGLEGYNGISYRNPDDPRLWVPKLSGIGYTLNFAHPWAWPVMLLILAAPLLVVIVIILAARS